LAKRYGVTPSRILEEPASILSLVQLAAMNESDQNKKHEKKMKEASQKKR